MANANLDLRNDSDADLIQYMKWRSDHPDAAKAAFGAFHARHVEYMHSACRRAFGVEVTDPDIDDLVQEIFWRAYERIETFEFRDDAGDNADRARLQVRAWLGKIANRIFLSSLRREKRQVRLVTGQDDRIGQCQPRPTTKRKLSKNEELVRRGLDEVLTERERRVVETFAAYYNPESAHHKSPPEAVQELCRVLATTPENVRQIRCRALAKLRDSILAAKSEPSREEESANVAQRKGKRSARQRD